MLFKARKKELADKLVSGKKISKAEKHEISYYLTGDASVERKKGRPSKWLRDCQLAFEYLSLIAEGKQLKNKIRDKLIEKHGLTDKQNTFYSALSKGIKSLEGIAKQWIYDVENGYAEISDKNDLDTTRAKNFLQLIAVYRKQD